MKRDRHWTCPLPDEPVLAEYALAANDAGIWAYIVDHQWRWAYMSDEARISQSPRPELAPVPLGEHFFSRASVDGALMSSTYDESAMREIWRAVGSWVIADTPGGRDGLRELVDPRLAEAVDEITGPRGGAVISYRFETTFSKGTAVPTVCTNQRIFDSAGRYLGVMMQAKPAVGMSVISQVVGTGDLGHFERIHRVSRAQRQSAGILFADLEGSSRLSRRLSTAAYFALGRRLVGAADAAVVQAGGIVGRHVGDGVVAFFLASTLGSEAAAAEACISATRTLRTAVAEVAERSDLEAGDVTLRFGLHWGSTLYMGLIATSGRSEVTALGDEVNEAARIEACATGGRALASKALIERLHRDAAGSLGINQERVSYTALADLTTTTEKARRDAPAIAVTEV